MKNKKTKSLVKTARKAFKKELAADIERDLNNLFANFEQVSKKTPKIIGKASGRLAKKLSSLIKIDKSIFIKNNVEISELKASATASSIENKKAPAITQKTFTNSLKDKTKTRGRNQVRKPVTKGEVTGASEQAIKKSRQPRSPKVVLSDV